MSIEARQVANGVVVLHPVHPAHRHAARIGEFAFLGLERLDVGDDGVSLRLGRVRHSRRRHVSRTEV